MNYDYDVIVIGLGAMGSSALYQLSKQSDAKVLGIERFTLPHEFGSSHGGSRLIRLASAEGKKYTPFARRSLEIIADLQSTTDETLYYPGALFLAPKTHPGFFDKTTALADENNIRYEMIDSADIQRRYPQCRQPDNVDGYTEHRMGTLHPERLIAHQLNVAAQNGAEIHYQEPFLSLEKNADGTVTVNTSTNIYRADKVVISTGAWLSEVVTEALNVRLDVHTGKQFYFRIADDFRERYSPEHFPAVLRLLDKTQAMLLFPDIENNGIVKLAPWSLMTETGAAVDPDSVTRNIENPEKQAVYERFIEPYFNGITPKCVAANTCLYTVAPNYQFLIDYHPHYDQSVLLVAACSGHGFKHSPAIGEALAQQTLTGTSDLDLLGNFEGKK